MQRISSRDNPRLKQLRRQLRAPSAYREGGSVWLEGEHLLQACLARGGALRSVLVSTSAWLHEPLRALAQAAPEVLLLDDARFGELSALQPNVAIGALVDPPPAGELRGDVDTLVLDRLQDAGNVGSVLRSAAALGVQQVAALPGTAALWSPKVLRAGMGAHFGLRLVEGVEADALEALRVPLLATSSHAEAALHEVDLPWPCAWVLGHEGQGIAPALQQRCAMRLRIPQPGGEESLNVAAAAAVCLYESARQRVA